MLWNTLLLYYNLQGYTHTHTHTHHTIHTNLLNKNYIQLTECPLYSVMLKDHVDLALYTEAMLESLQARCHVCSILHEYTNIL